MKELPPNYIRHLTGFFYKVAIDRHLNPTHISMYIALFQFWNCNRFRNPISISRDEIMRISKISSYATYHKCLKLLDASGYIKYEPSFNPFKGSHVYLFNLSDELNSTAVNEFLTSSNFEYVGKQVLNKHHTGTEPTDVHHNEQALVSYINNTNSINNTNTLNSLNLNRQAQKDKNKSPYLIKADPDKKEKSSAKKEKPIPLPNPTAEEVINYFREQNYPEIEASKFFNYFKSIGWLVGGKTPMTDWPAAARNWMINSPKFTPNEQTDRTKSLNTSAGKDYSEPL